MKAENTTQFSQHVGNRIKFYRKLKQMSLSQLADEIYKSKSTLSKYENGHIAIDVDSLYDIARVLGVDVNQFVDYEIPRTSVQTSYHKNPFGGKDNLYLYHYDGRTKRIVKTLLVLRNSQTKDNVIPCVCYMDVPSLDEYAKCKYFYTGTMTYFDLVSYVTLNNQLNPMEQIGLMLLNPFHFNYDTWGFEFGISYNPITPFALKVMISTNRINDQNLTKESLILTKNELRMIKNMNMMLLNQIEP